MFKIIKYGCEYNLSKKCVATIDATYDGIRVVLNDNTEIRFSMNVSPQVKAIIPIAKISSSDDITLNLDNAIAGKYDSVLLLGKQETQTIQPQVIIVPEKTETKQEEITKTPPKNKGGRPKKNTTKKS